ncbi:MAG: response regulator [Elusimicrobiaceae bacterium]|jgi:diguanylate cyclase (GGDEF)-like protein|uniref:Response regulator n=1 Tax=Candidatus Avelusimicrobium gallicola TaxID=2562704 RepID=A0A928DQC1_9BACT|nr:response regulator [Elusimicrobium sp.]MBQ9971271.1 response regulator [Elusimicrobiaceae bacterium]
MEHNAKILLADDSHAIRFLVSEILTSAGFTVVEAEDGQEAIEKTYKENPDLLILDYEMPRKTGFEVVQEVRSRTGYLHTPIIIFTAVTDKSTKLEGLGLDIDDYLTKPADEDEIVARVKLLLKRNKQKMDCNPLTRLPGNPSIQARVENQIAAGQPFAVLYCDLNNFKSFNDKYGFEAGDRVLKTESEIIVAAATQDPNSFVGHIGGDDFIVVCAFDKAEAIAQEIASKTDQIAPSFYNEEDRKNGYMVSTNRRGETEKFKFLSIGIGVVHNTKKPLTSFAMVSNIGSELKCLAKKHEGGSYYVLDRRAS